MQAIIAGGGIGGLTAALALHQAGIDVRVFERVREPAPLGVGINLLPHASRELHALGLAEALDAMAIRTRAMRYFTRRGRLAIAVDCGRHAGYRWPQYSLHRGRFQMLLLDTLRERAGAQAVITGHTLADYRQDAGGVDAFFDTREGDRIEVRGDVLIGADGLHSRTRALRWPDEGRPLYSGMTVYRGAVETTPYLDGESMIIVGDKRLRLVAYPLSGEAQQRGRSLVNWIAALDVPREGTQPEDWNRRADAAALETLYADWRFDWLDVPALIAATADIFEFPVHDRDPLPAWQDGRVTLLGDAAHPLIPVSSSGAVHAIIDARALAFHLASHREDPPAGLAAYEADRRPKTSAVVQASRQNGPDQVLEIVRERCPEDADDIHAHVPLAQLQAVIDAFRDRSGFAVERLNNLPAYDPPA